MSDADRRRDHDNVRRMIRLAADPETVWAVIGDFGRMAEWHPLIRKVELSELEGDLYRHLIDADDALYFERLVERGPHHLTYEIVDGPLPVTDYRATLSCVAEPDGCHVFWSAYFVPVETPGHLADEIVATFYEIGLEALGQRFGTPD